MISGHRISVIIPCLNEAEGLRPMLARMPTLVDEVVVVDNGSTDGTIAVAQAAGARIVSEATQGYGRACLRGLREASSDLIVKLDGDCTYPLEAIEPMVRALIEDQLEFVSGSRFPLRDSRAMSSLNRMGNRLLTAAANALFNLRLVDSLSGMWAIRKTAAAQLNLGQGGIPFSQEIKVEACRQFGSRATERPIAYERRVGSSKLMPLRDGVGCLRFLLTRRIALAREQGGRGAGLAYVSERVALLSLVSAAAIWPLSQALKETLVAIGVIVWLLGKIIGRARWVRTAAILPFALLWLVGVVSMVHSVSLGASLQGLMKIVKWAAIVSVTADVVRTRRRVWLLLSALVFGAAAASLDGIAQWFLGVDPLYGHPAGIALFQVPRLTATFHHANDFGVYGVSVLPLALAVALGTNRSRARWWASGALGVLTLALVLTFSRGAALAMGFSLIVFWIARRAWKTLTLVGILAAIGMWWLPAPIRAWASTHGSWFDMLVLPERPQMWQTALQMIRAHPIIGVGINTFVLNYARYQSPNDHLHPAYAHNHYLHLTAELGLLGFAAFSWLLIRTATVWRRLLRSDESWVRLASAGLGCGAIGFLTIGLLESALYSSHTNLGFWLCLGVLHGMGAREPARR